MNYYVDVLKKYAVFNGRASRKEYWMFFLFNVIIACVLYFIPIISGMSVLLIFYFLYGLAIIIPSIAVLVRRLHDTNHSGWWYFIVLIPIIGGIWVLILLIKNGDIGENQYGPNPKEAQNTTPQIQNPSN